MPFGKHKSEPFDTPVNYQQEVLALTLVRVLIAQDEASKALSLLEPWHAQARAQARTSSEIESLLLTTLALQAQSKREQAIQMCLQA